MLPFFGLSLALNRFLATVLTLAANYTAIQAGPASADATLTFKTDGTWAYTVGAGDTSGGTPTTGTWLLAGGVATDYELQYVTGTQVNAPTITNGAAAYTTISANLAYVVHKLNGNASADVTVNIRRILNTGESVSKLTNIAVDGT